MIEWYDKWRSKIIAAVIFLMMCIPILGIVVHVCSVCVRVDQTRGEMPKMVFFFGWRMFFEGMLPVIITYWYFYEATMHYMNLRMLNMLSVMAVGCYLLGAVITSIVQLERHHKAWKTQKEIREWAQEHRLRDNS